MFTTPSRSRAHERPNRLETATQEAVAPDSGSDSCYGVRSLEGSCVEWEGEMRPIPGQEGDEVNDVEGQKAVEKDDKVVVEELKIALSEEVVVREEIIPTLTPVDEASPIAISTEIDPEEATRTIRPTPLALPKRSVTPTFLLPTLSTSPIPSPASSAPPSPPANIDLDSQPAISSDYSSDTDDHSAPPSPTSQTSLPSYLASEMSMSMPSSPGLGYSTDESSRQGAVLQALQRERARSGVGAMLPGYSGRRGEEEGEDQDLVIPVLSLPSSSLHLSFRAYEGVVEGLKIALVGDVAASREFLRALGQREDLVDLGKSGVGLVRSGKLEVVFVMGLSEVQLRQRIVQCYISLDSLLSTSEGWNDNNLEESVAKYADKEGWIHAYLTVGDDQSEIEASCLEGLVHRLPIQDTTNITTASNPYSPDIPRLDDPTPLARNESSSYFTHPITHATPVSPIPEVPHSPLTPSSDGVISAFLAAIDPPTIISNSTANFLAWRPAQLESSQSSLETPSAGTGTSGLAGSEGDEADIVPTPTVARAQGGGEWEAGLSRRVAKRRESGGMNEEGRRRKSKGHIEAFPLFPPTSKHEEGNVSSLGLGARNLLEKTFGPLRDGMRGWKRVLVVATIMGVMGWGWWVSNR